MDGWAPPLPLVVVAVEELLADRDHVDQRFVGGAREESGQVPVVRETTPSAEQPGVHRDFEGEFSSVHPIVVDDSPVTTEHLRDVWVCPIVGVSVHEREVYPQLVTWSQVTFLVLLGWFEKLVFSFRDHCREVDRALAGEVARQDAKQRR